MKLIDTKAKEIQKKEIKCIVEAVLFASSEPISLRKLQEIVSEYQEVPKDELCSIIEEYAHSLHEEGRAFKLEEIAQGYLLRTCPQYSSYISKVSKKTQSKLSQASLEVVSIIAFRQPITRAEIEEIRGVDCSSMIATLIERELVETAGKLEAPGRPTLYRVTKKFMIHFGLSHLKEIKNLSNARQS